MTKNNNNNLATKINEIYNGRFNDIYNEVEPFMEVYVKPYITYNTTEEELKDALVDCMFEVSKMEEDRNGKPIENHLHYFRSIYKYRLQDLTRHDKKYSGRRKNEILRKIRKLSEDNLTYEQVLNILGEKTIVNYLKISNLEKLRKKVEILSEKELVDENTLLKKVENILELKKAGVKLPEEEKELLKKYNKIKLKDTFYGKLKGFMKLSVNNPKKISEDKIYEILNFSEREKRLLKLFEKFINQEISLEEILELLDVTKEEYEGFQQIENIESPLSYEESVLEGSSFQYQDNMGEIDKGYEKIDCEGMTEEQFLLNQSFKMVFSKKNEQDLLYIAIEHIGKGRKLQDLSEELGIGVTTIFDKITKINKSKDKLEKAIKDIKRKNYI